LLHLQVLLVLVDDAVMPELPEVEVVRSGLSSTAAGRPVVAVVRRAPALRWPVPADLDARLAGRVEAQQLAHQRERDPGLGRYVEPFQLQGHIGPVAGLAAALFEDGVFLLEIEQGP
jgi:Na+/H+-translocating membrane pyrophosphatase